MIVSPAREPGVQHRLTKVGTPFGLKQTRIRNGSEVEDEIADCDPGSPLLTVRREDPERQVLDGEIAVAVRALHPARQGGIVGGAIHGSFALGKPAHAMS